MNTIEEAKDIQNPQEKQPLKNTKEYPKAITLKKGIVLVLVILLAGVMITILTNMRRSTQKQEVEYTQKLDDKAATGGSVDWYQHQTVRQPTTAMQLPKTEAVAASPQATDNGGAVVAPNAANMQTTKNANEEMKKILSAPISSNQINDTSGATAQTVRVAPSSNQNQSADTGQQSSNDQNMQSEKKTFLKVNSVKEADYLQEGLKNPLSPYEVKAGTIIPAILISGINSDLPGQITAQVRQNVYDTIAGKYLLVPQGAKLTGLYDSQVAYGQSRVLVVWKRIIYPNGQSIDLDGMPGVDMTGYAGFNDKVNNHYMKIFGSVILMSAISAGAQLSQPLNDNNNNDNPTVNQTLAASLGTNIMNSTNMILQKNLGVQPTLEIRPGYLMNVSVTKDIVFPGAYQEGTKYAS